MRTHYIRVDLRTFSDIALGVVDSYKVLVLPGQFLIKLDDMVVFEDTYAYKEVKTRVTAVKVEELLGSDSVEIKFELLTEKGLSRDTSKIKSTEDVAKYYVGAVCELLRAAERDGILLQVDIVSKEPLAMGNYEQVISSRLVRK